jgi:hypothetical protein
MSFFKPRLEIMESRETPTILPVDPTGGPAPVGPPPEEPAEPAPTPPAENPPPPPMPEW